MSRFAKRERISIQQPVYSDDNTYKSRRLTGHTDVLSNIPARWVPTGGTETYRGGQTSNLQMEATAIGYFEITDPRQAIDTKWKVLHNGKLYEIVSARYANVQNEGRFREMHVYVKGPANG